MFSIFWKDKTARYHIILIVSYLIFIVSDCNARQQWGRPIAVCKQSSTVVVVVLRATRLAGALRSRAGKALPSYCAVVTIFPSRIMRASQCPPLPGSAEERRRCSIHLLKIVRYFRYFRFLFHFVDLVPSFFFPCLDISSTAGQVAPPHPGSQTI